MEAPQLIDEVSIAFRGTALPPATALLNEHCNECIETSRVFWDTPNSFIAWESAAERRGAYVEAALLTPEAWRYYLPALLIWCVRDTGQVDALLNNLAHELTPRADSGRDWFEPRSIGFSPEQRCAIVTFLEWYREHEQAEWASIGAEHPNEVAAAIDFWRVSNREDPLQVSGDIVNTRPSGTKPR
jgi:hypothetical protein